MNKICDGVYQHRGKLIIKDEQGISIIDDLNRSDDPLYLFPTFTDAKLFIDKHHDGSNTREPRIIGEWKELNKNN